MITKSFVITFILAALAAAAWADEADDLAKQVSKDLRSVERDMMGGKKDKAIEGLLAAAGVVEKIRAAAPDHKQLATLDRKMTKLKKDLERRTGKTIDLAAGTVKGEKKATPEKKVKQNDADKLPGGVTHRLNKVEPSLESAEHVLSDGGSRGTDDYRIEQAVYCIKNAEGFIKEIESGYADHIDHPDVKAAMKRIAEVKEQLNRFTKTAAEKAALAGEAEAQRDALCAEWLKKLGPYVTGLGSAGHDPDRYLIASATGNVDDLNKQCGIYKEAKRVFEAYKAVDFSYGKTWEMEEAEKDLSRALEDFPAALEESVGYVLKPAVEKIDRTAKFLASEKEQKWRNDPGEKPFVLDDKRMEDMRTLIATAAKVASADNPALVSARQKLDVITKENEERRRVCTERTFMIPDRFKGTDIEDLKSKARALVLGDHPKAVVLRATVITEDWNEEDVVEATDTTNTAIRRRITRSVSAQVAARNGTEVLLFTVHVAKNRRTDGTWGSLYGNVMFTDSMLEKNVEKPL